jgi:peptide/nickel transport system permease protein
MRDIGRWLVLQVGRAGVAAWAIASFVFILSRIAAVGPAETLFDEADGGVTLTSRADASASRNQARQTLKERLGLAEPVFYFTRTGATPPVWHWHGTHNQYHHWASGLLHGQLGVSFRDGQPVAPRLGAALAYTLPLTGLAALVAVGWALVLGLALASGPQPEVVTGWRAGVQLLLTGLQGLPLFTLALGLLFLFANPDAFNILPAYSSADSPTEWQPGLYLLRLALPLLALVLAALPELTLPLAAALRHELRTNYATTAQAKGLTTKQLLRRHALPNALLPLLTSFTGLLPTLVAGAIVVETIFALPGTGRLLAEAVVAHDYPVVVAGVLLTAGAKLLALALTDVLYALADPRIRLAP